MADINYRGMAKTLACPAGPSLLCTSLMVFYSLKLNRQISWTVSQHVVLANSCGYKSDITHFLCMLLLLVSIYCVLSI